MCNTLNEENFVSWLIKQSFDPATWGLILHFLHIKEFGFTGNFKL